MTNHSPATLRLHRLEVLHPEVVARPADPSETNRLAPWFAVHGENPAAVDIARYADGGGGHAPETLRTSRALLTGAGPGTALLYRHTGVQAQPLEPLLPGLLHGLAHEGLVHAVRRVRGDISLQPGAAELALMAAMVATSGAVLLIDDLQERVAPQGELRAAPVVLALFLQAAGGSAST